MPALAISIVPIRANMAIALVDDKFNIKISCDWRRLIGSIRASSVLLERRGWLQLMSGTVGTEVSESRKCMPEKVANDGAIAIRSVGLIVCRYVVTLLKNRIVRDNKSVGSTWTNTDQ